MDNSKINFKSNELKTVKELIEQGQPKFGVFNKVERINHLDYSSHLLSGKSTSKLRKKLRSNQFCFIQIVQAPYRICFAVATLNWVTSSFFYIYNRKTDILEVIEALQPFTRNTQFNESVYEGFIKFSSKKLSINLNFSEKSLNIDVQGDDVNLMAKFDRSHLPLSVCTPTGKTGWTYTQKEPINDIVGELTYKESYIDLLGATATIDWSVGYMRRVTNWFWACITDYLPDGRYLALNLATGVNESGASENACWLDGNRYHLPAVLFQRSQDGKIWFINNQVLNWSKVSINLTFTPINCYKKNDRLIIVDSIFEQWIGYYSGTIILDDEVINFNNIMGLAEDHYAKW